MFIFLSLHRRHLHAELMGHLFRSEDVVVDRMLAVLAIRDENQLGFYLAGCGSTLDHISYVQGPPGTLMRTRRSCGTIPHVPFDPLAAIAFLMQHSYTLG